jgi:hypothetical protein
MKLPFAVHPAVTPLAALDVSQPLSVACAPRGDRFAYSVDGEVVVADAEGAVVSRFPRADVRGLAFSPDGAQLGLVDVRFAPPNRQAATLAIVDLRGGLVAQCDLPDWGEVSHQSYGGKAPSLVFHPDGRRVYARIALMGEETHNSVAVLDVDGAHRVQRLPPSANHVFSLCVSKDRLFVQYSQCGDESGLAWLDPDTSPSAGATAGPPARSSSPAPAACGPSATAPGCGAPMSTTPPWSPRRSRRRRGRRARRARRRAHGSWPAAPAARARRSLRTAP